MDIKSIRHLINDATLVLPGGMASAGDPPLPRGGGGGACCCSKKKESDDMPLSLTKVLPLFLQVDLDLYNLCGDAPHCCVAASHSLQQPLPRACQTCM